MKFLKRQVPALLLCLALLLSACSVVDPAMQPQTSGSTQTTQGTQPSTQTTKPTTPPTEPATDPSVQPTEPATEPSVLPTEPDAAHRHTDHNQDELCDQCGISVIVRLDFYAINDLHGVFMDTADNPGVDELTTYFKNAYADDAAYEILLSSGDMWQGSVESSSNKGELMTRWMNDLGFVAMTLGNHEYDWGSDSIAKNAQIANFPFLGINIKDSNATDSYCQSSVVVERGGIKVGIIGAVDNFLSSISGEFNDGLSFSTSNLSKLIQAEAQRLRQEEECDFIVLSVHGGLAESGTKNYYGSFDYYDVSLSDGDVDLVFEGHSHYKYVLKDANGVYHIQAGGYNKAIGHAAVTFNLVTDSYEITRAETIGKETYGSAALADDPVVEELFGQYFPEGNPYTTVIGTNGASRSSSAIGQKIAELYLKKGRELWGDQYDIVLGGGFLKTRSPYSLNRGNVTYSQLYSLLPFDNSLVLCRVTGKQLKSVFINSTSSSYFSAYDASLVNSIVDSKTYYVVTDTYTSFYKYNMFPEVARLEDYYARDLLKDYIAAGNWG